MPIATHPGSHLVKRSLRLLIGEKGAPVRTSLALEPEFWDALEAAAKAARQSVPAWIAGVAARFPSQSLASAVRVQLLQEARGKARGAA